MLSYCTDYLATMPDITVYMNCDTRLAINLSLFNLNKNDEFVFAIKNYDYVESSCAILKRFSIDDIDDNGEVLFKITPEESKLLKPSAFYNFSILINAFNRNAETEYKKLTDNGNIILEYGAHDLTIPQEQLPLTGDAFFVTDVRLEAPDAIVEPLQKTDAVIGAKLSRV